MVFGLLVPGWFCLVFWRAIPSIGQTRKGQGSLSSQTQSEHLCLNVIRPHLQFSSNLVHAIEQPPIIFTAPHETSLMAYEVDFHLDF